MSNVAKGLCLTAAQTATANTTTDVSTVAKEITCERARRVAVSIEFTGANAGSSGVVTFNFQTKVGNGGWSTELITVSASLNANNKVTGIGKIIDVDGFTSIRLYSITNADPTYNALTCQAYFGKAYGEHEIADGN